VFGVLPPRERVTQSAREVSVYAIIQAGGRQLRVEEGGVVAVDRLEAKVGDEISFDRVLFVDRDGGAFTAGAPFVEGARVIGSVDEHTRGPKIRVFRKKRRKGWRRTLGHRTALTEVRITRIDAG
jgi:large subunit ribosomal protein L21